MGTMKSMPSGSMGMAAIAGLAVGGQDHGGLVAQAGPTRSGRAPQTSANPPVLAKGTASLVAKRIFTRRLRRRSRLQSIMGA